MNKDGIVFESALGKKDKDGKYVEDKTEVLKIDKDGATVTGKLTVKDKGDAKKEIEPRIIFEADPFGSGAIDPHVKIGGFDVDHNKLSIGTIGSDNSIALISDNSIEPVAIAKSSKKNN